MLFPKSLLAVAGSLAIAAGASLQRVSNFGDNLSNIDMFIYVPDKLAATPPVIVAMHVCGGSAQEWFSDNNLHTYADSQGFIIIYPQTTHMSNCWDVNNKASLTHNGGGDAGTIVNMVKYTLQKYKGDASRVFAMGGSSGAMMTNVMLGSYPDIFAAGAAYSGVPFACALGDANATPSSSNQTCAQGQIQKTAAQWGDFVRTAYPGFTGKRPSMAVFHGLADSLVKPACAQQEMDQWSNVLGVSLTKKVSGVPSSQYTQYVYGDGSKLVGYLGQGVGHWAPVNNPVMLKFFGILS